MATRYNLPSHGDTEVVAKLPADEPDQVDSMREASLCVETIHKGSQSVHIMRTWRMLAACLFGTHLALLPRFRALRRVAAKREDVANACLFGLGQSLADFLFTHVGTAQTG